MRVVSGWARRAIMGNISGGRCGEGAGVVLREVDRRA